MTARRHREPYLNQVQSDEPQGTVNQRFEFFHPEKRPSFLEDASYLETAIDLFFSRSIVDPRLGARLTGEAEGLTIGALFANDEAPGERVPDDDPLLGETSLNAVVQLRHDLGRQSGAGAI